MTAKIIRKCPDCKGEGKIPCTVCGGFGQRKLPIYRFSYEGVKAIEGGCQACSETGKATCPRCMGTGKPFMQRKTRKS